MKTIIAWVVIIFLVILGVWYVKQSRIDVTPTPAPSPSPVTNTNATGTLPTVGTQASSSEIVVDSPKVGDKISSPLTVKGKARGSWYFEASAPVVVVDANGKVLGQGHVEAQSDWMTTNFVPFAGTITYEKSTTESGAVIFMNDNPSGEPARSKYYAVPILFK